MRRIRILLADDETLMRRLLAQQLSLEKDFEIVGEAENGRQAVQQAMKLRPDVVLMDLSMPVLNGIQATEQIVARHPYIRVIVLTALQELASVGRMSGAVECLEKTCTPPELCAAIRRAYESRVPPTLDHFEQQDHQHVVDAISLRAGLTEREKAVLVKALRTELTIQQIATELGEEAGESVSISAVKHTLERVMVKLRLEPRTRAGLVKRVLEFEQTK